MNRIVSISLVLLLMFNSINKFGVIVLFKLNQEYISKNLCENRFKKGSTCNGKCYLNKELKEHDHEHGDSKSNKVTVRFMDDYVHNILDFNISPKTVFIPLSWNFYHRQDALSEYSYSIFHPPSYAFLS